MGLKATEYPNLYLDSASGIYHVRKMVDGKALTRTTGQTTFKQAVRQVPAILVGLADQKGERKIPTLDAYWLTYRKAQKKAPKTWKNHERMMESLWLPQLGRLNLDDINASTIKRTLNWRRLQKKADGEKLSEGTVTSEQALLHAVLEAAVEDDLLEKHPMRKIERKPYETRKRVLTAAEQLAVEKVATPLVKRFFQFLLGTGIRLEEVRGIRPERDFDWAGNQFTVTGKGSKVRKVPLIPMAREKLLAVVREQIADNEGDAKHHRSDRKGGLWKQASDELRQWLYLAADKADIPRFSPHTLRHTFATRYLAGGGDIYILSLILGHSSVAVTEKVYAHLLTEDLSSRSTHVSVGL